MNCYECSMVGTNSNAVGLCHHCSAALCTDHACVVADPMTTTYPLVRTVVVPKQARLFLCGTCLQALRQTNTETIMPETSEKCCA
jgi:hypothetical protein